MRINAVDNFRVSAVEKIDLTDYNPRWAPKWAAPKCGKDDKKISKRQEFDILEENKQKLTGTQELFWANSFSILKISSMDRCFWNRGNY